MRCRVRCGDKWARFTASTRWNGIRLLGEPDHGLVQLIGFLLLACRAIRDENVHEGSAKRKAAWGTEALNVLIWRHSSTCRRMFTAVDAVDDAVNIVRWQHMRHKSIIPGYGEITIVRTMRPFMGHVPRAGVVLR